MDYNLDKSVIDQSNGGNTLIIQFSQIDLLDTQSEKRRAYDQIFNSIIKDPNLYEIPLNININQETKNIDIHFINNHIIRTNYEKLSGHSPNWVVEK